VTGGKQAGDRFTEAIMPSRLALDLVAHCPCRICGASRHHQRPPAFDDPEARSYSRRP